MFVEQNPCRTVPWNDFKYSAELSSLSLKETAHSEREKGKNPKTLIMLLLFCVLVDSKARADGAHLGGQNQQCGDAARREFPVP